MMELIKLVVCLWIGGLVFAALYWIGMFFLVNKKDKPENKPVKKPWDINK